MNLKPADSAQNQIVRLDDLLMIFSGWHFKGLNEKNELLWGNDVNTYFSMDGANWIDQKTQAPFDSYSNLVVLKDHIFSYDSDIYSSVDGRTWDHQGISPVKNSFYNAVVEHDSVYLIGKKIFKSENGIEFKYLGDSPWESERVEFKTIAYNGKIIMIGGASGMRNSDLGEDEQPITKYYDTVWISEDGKNWQSHLVNSYISGRIWQTLILHDNKILLTGGFNQYSNQDCYGNFGDAWFSSNGYVWVPYLRPVSWSCRHASYAVNLGINKTILMAGYGGGGFSRLYNDAYVINANVYFSKAEGELSELNTWGQMVDGTGPSPASFDSKNNVYVLNNRFFYKIPKSIKKIDSGGYFYIANDFHDTKVVIEGSEPFNICAPNLAKIDFAGGGSHKLLECK